MRKIPIVLRSETGDNVQDEDAVVLMDSTGSRKVAGLTPSHVTVSAGEFPTVGGDTDETITILGVLATDIVLVTVHTAGASPVTVVDASASAGQIDVDMSADPSDDHVLSYQVLRAIVAAV